MTRSRVAVASLGALSASFAMAVGAVSLTRIAGENLGFPDGLQWTLTGSVDVAAIAGGIMWTAGRGPVQRIGRPMNIVCTTVSGIGVGLDHATHAAPGWQWVAFAVGMFVPALATWILHVLAVGISDHEDAPTSVRPATASSEREHRTTSTAPDREQAPRAATASTATATTSTTTARTSPPSLVATTGTPAASRPVSPTRSWPVGFTPLRQLSGPHPDWMTVGLVNEVAVAMWRAKQTGRRYGETTIIKNHALPDGGKVGSGRAKALLATIDRHGLLRTATA